MNKIRFAAFWALMLAVCLTAVSAEEPFIFRETYYGGSHFCTYTGTPVPVVNGYGVYVCNLADGTVMVDKNPDDLVYPASTVKLMTAIVAYENIPDLQTVITASPNVVAVTRGSHMGVKAGETFTAEQLLYAVLVTGANDAANMLAEYVGGSIDGFCDMMNEKAARIGATNTVFTNPTGLHNAAMHTTTRDIAKIAAYFYGIGDLFAMSDTARYIIEPTAQTSTRRTLLNRNLLISRVRADDYYLPGAHGMSLGGTDEAGACIVATATGENGIPFLCVVMNAVNGNETDAACADAYKLLSVCLNDFVYADVLSEKSAVCEVEVRLASGSDYVTLYPKSDVKALLPKDFDYLQDITVEPRIPEAYVNAPVAEGQTLGEAVVKYKNDLILGSTELISGRSLDKSSVLYALDRASGFFTGKWFRVFAVSAAVLIGLYFAASVFYRARSRRSHYGRRR